MAIEKLALSNVVIVCWNALEYTKATLDSLFKNTTGYYYLTLLNNGSSDETHDYIHSLNFPDNVLKIEIIENEENLGIGTAYNQGFYISEKMKAEYTVFCNNDLLFSHNWLNKFENFMKKNKNVVIANPIRPSVNDIHPEKTSTMDKLLSIAPCDISTEIELFIKPLSTFESFCREIEKVNTKKYGPVREIIFPDSTSSCVCIARNNILRKYGFFANPIFNAYGGEDIDMCWTVLSDGYKCFVLNNVYIHHFRGKSMKANNENVAERLKKSNTILYKTWKREIEIFCNSNIVRPTGKTWLLHKIKNNMEELQ